MTTLPNGWAKITLGELRPGRNESLDPRKTPEETFEVYSVPAFPTGKCELLRGAEIGSSKQRVEPGTVLLCGINPRINRVWIVAEPQGNQQIASTEWIAFRPVPEIIPKYLAYFVQQTSIRDYLAGNASGVGGSLMRVKGRTCAPIEFPVAPSNEQQRIAQEIDKQFTRLDAAVAALKRVQDNLKRYRAAVLKAACEGRLVPNASESSLAPGLLRPVKDLLSEPLANGRSPASADSGTKILRLTSMQGNFIDFSECRLGVLDDLNRDNLRVKEGDIFVARGSGSVHLVGRASLARILPPDYVAFPDTMIRIRANSAEVEPLYFLYLWNSAMVRSQIESIARTTAGIFKISQADIERINLPLVPLEAQRRVVALLEEQFSVIESFESTTARSEMRAERLRQSILRRAFEGKLVSQEPYDEPATTLLERIRIAREATPKASLSRGRWKKEGQHVS